MHNPLRKNRELLDLAGASEFFGHSRLASRYSVLGPESVQIKRDRANSVYKGTHMAS